jgi:hypothetical protein
MLPRPLPSNVIADERSTALGRAISAPLAAPIWTKRMGTPSGPAFAPAMSRRSALFPHR